MAAGKWKMYELARKRLADGTFDLDGNTFKVTLHTSLSNANTLSANSILADITNQLATANGYTAGGVTVAATWVQSGATVTFDTADAAWTAAGGAITARFAVLSALGTLNGLVNPILAVCLLNVTPADESAADGNPFTVQMNAGGLFTLSGMTTD